MPLCYVILLKVVPCPLPSCFPSSEYSGLIPFRIDRLDLLAVQWTLKSLLQHHSSKTSILCHWAFLMVRISHPSTTTRKTIAFTIWIFVGKVMSLLFNTLSRFFTAPKEQASFNFMAIITVCSGVKSNQKIHHTQLTVHSVCIASTLVYT